MWFIILQICAIVICAIWVAMTGMFIVGICLDDKINTNWIRPAFMICYIILGLSALFAVISTLGLLICLFF
jgi:hypothetical protein